MAARTTLLGLLAALSLAAPLSPSSARGADQLTVVASIFPVYEMAREVGGDRVSVSLLVPPGAEAHSWEPRASDVTRIRQSSCFIYLGEFLEPWAPRALEAAGVKASLAVAKGLTRMDGDPHLWLDFSLDARMADAIAAEFTRLDPRGAEQYRANASAFKDRLLELDAAYREGLASCPRREMVVAGHASFGYLAARYGLKQVAVSGLSPDSEPSPRKVAEVVRSMRERGDTAVFFQDLENPALAETIARETGAEALPLSAGHELTEAQWRGKVTFLGLMEGNLAVLRRGLGCE